MQMAGELGAIYGKEPASLFLNLARQHAGFFREMLDRGAARSGKKTVTKTIRGKEYQFSLIAPGGGEALAFTIALAFMVDPALYNDVLLRMSLGLRQGGQDRNFLEASNPTLQNLSRRGDGREVALGQAGKQLIAAAPHALAALWEISRPYLDAEPMSLDEYSRTRAVPANSSPIVREWTMPLDSGTPPTKPNPEAKSAGIEIDASAEVKSGGGLILGALAIAAIGWLVFGRS